MLFFERGDIVGNVADGLDIDQIGREVPEHPGPRGIGIIGRDRPIERKIGPRIDHDSVDQSEKRFSGGFATGGGRCRASRGLGHGYRGEKKSVSP